MEKDDAEPFFCAPVSLWELTYQSCRYVVNDGPPSTYLFCGRPKHRLSYCLEHYTACHRTTEILSDDDESEQNDE